MLVMQLDIAIELYYFKWLQTYHFSFFKLFLIAFTY